MFTKRITPFACIIISLLVALITFVGVSSYASVKEQERINEARLQSATFSEFAEFIENVGEDVDKYEKLSTILSLIDAKYVHEYNKDDIWEILYSAALLALGDQHSQYITAEQYEELIDSSDGDFVGVGVHAAYDIDTDGIYIFGVIPNSPAERAGLKTGDIIVAVEDIEASEENYYLMLDAVIGESGTTVNLKVLRGEEIIDFKVVRGSVAVESVLYEKLEGDIAFIRILTFSDVTVSEQFEKIIETAQQDGCNSFIFDLRNNLGGDLEEICAVLDLLLPEGPIINIVDKNGDTKTRNSDADCITGKMAVICNGNTASAAELFTAALRDYNLATVVGTKTFGKGTMQTTKRLSDGSAVKISSALYNPPSNVSYDKIGITPHSVVELKEEWEQRFYKMPKEEDTQLQMAISLLNATN